MANTSVSRLDRGDFTEVTSTFPQMLEMVSSESVLRNRGDHLIFYELEVSKSFCLSS